MTSAVFDATVLTQGELLGEQGVDGFTRGHLAAFEATQGGVEDLDGARHFEADHGLLDALDQRWNEFKLRALKQGQQREADRMVLRVPWQKPPSKRRREIIVPKSASRQDARPIRAETRAKLVASIAHGRRWLDEIVAGTVSVDQIAAREKCSIRQVSMTISLAFLAPTLVQAAVEGRLPRGIGVTRLRDAPAEWSRQYAMLGLSA